MARCWRRPDSPGSSTCSRSPYGGFCTTFSRSNDRFNLDELSWELGRQWETMRISLKFYSCVGSNHTTLDAIRNHAADDAVRRRRYRIDRGAWIARDGRTRRLALYAAGPDLGADESAVLRRDALARRRRVRRSVLRRSGGRPAAHWPFEKGQRGGGPGDHRARLELPAHGARRSASEKRRQTRAKPSKRRAAAKTRFASEAEIVQKFKKLATHTVSDAKADAVVNLVLGAEKLARADEIATALAKG